MEHVKYAVKYRLSFSVQVNSSEKTECYFSYMQLIVCDLLSNTECLWLYRAEL